MKKLNGLETTAAQSTLNGRIIDHKVKEMPKNPFDFIWEPENMLSKKLPAPLQVVPGGVNGGSRAPGTGASAEDSSVFQSASACNHELVNANTLSATTLETSIANTTANENVTTAKPSYKKASKKSKSKSANKGSSKWPAKDAEKIFLVDEFNKQLSNSASNISGVLMNDSTLSVDNSGSKPTSANEKKLTMIDSSG